jgi:hypothetical protein
MARTAADPLAAARPQGERDTHLAQVLRANATSLASCAEDALYGPEAHPLLYRTGRSLGESDQVTAAADYAVGSNADRSAVSCQERRGRELVSGAGSGGR